MRKKNLLGVLLLAMPVLLALISVKARAQAAGPASGPASQRTASQSASPALEKPYDWKASFAKYPTGKVPRTADGKPDLQGIWSHSVLTPLERPGAQHKAELSEAEAREAEEAAHQSAINLRVEPTVTPPGEKTTDAYNSFWRDGYWYKVPITSLHTSQVVDPPDGRVPPLTPAARKREQ